MSDHPLGEQAVCQVAIVVKDIQASAKRWAAVLGVETPEPRETLMKEETNIRYRGQPTDGRAKLAFLKLGEVSLELIEPIGGPSIWREWLDEHGEGVHHIAFRVPDMPKAEAHLAEHGIQAVQTGDFKGGCYSYCDAAPQLGVLIELLAKK